MITFIKVFIKKFNNSEYNEKERNLISCGFKNSIKLFRDTLFRNIDINSDKFT